MDHHRFKGWLEDLVSGDEPHGVSELALSGFLRIVTHPGIFPSPTSLGDALAFVDALREHPNCVVVTPGARHWDIFTNLCRATGARGALIPDAYFAALAIESGSEWITMDGDYARFPGLRWRRPFD